MTLPPMWMMATVKPVSLSRERKTFKKRDLVEAVILSVGLTVGRCSFPLHNVVEWRHIDWWWRGEVDNLLLSNAAQDSRWKQMFSIDAILVLWLCVCAIHYCLFRVGRMNLPVCYCSISASGICSRSLFDVINDDGRGYVLMSDVDRVCPWFGNMAHMWM